MINEIAEAVVRESTRPRAVVFQYHTYGGGRVVAHPPWPSKSWILLSVGTWLWEERGAVLPTPVCTGWLEHSLQRRTMPVSSCGRGSWYQACDSHGALGLCWGRLWICGAAGLDCAGAGGIGADAGLQVPKSGLVQSQGAQGAQVWNGFCAVDSWGTFRFNLSVLRFPATVVGIRDILCRWMWSCSYSLYHNFCQCWHVWKANSACQCVYSAWPGAVLICVWRL